jgi:hypothetical protein
MAAIGEVIRYLRGCYEADNREASIFNLRSERVTHLEFLSKGGDFVRGLLDVVPVERGKALEAQKAAELYKTERSLVFGAVLLTGSVEGPRGRAEVFAPMFYYPARVEDMGEYAVLRVDWPQQRVNTRLLQAIMGNAAKDFDGWLGKIPNAPFQPTDVYDVIAALEEFAPGMDTAHLREFGNPEAALRSSPPINGERMAAHWGHVMALIPNSADTRGVLTEMEEVAGAERHSAPVRAVFGGESSGAARGKARRYTLPAQLSAAQEKAVWSASANTLTVLHGPPGTGKSYTSAVLALDHVARGQSVLIAARTDEALDVIMEKFEGLLGDASFILRGGRSGQFGELKESLDQLLSPAVKWESHKVIAEESELKRWLALRWAGAKLARAERDIARRIGQEAAWAAANSGTITGQAQRRMVEWKLRGESLAAERLDRFQQDSAAQHKHVAEYLRRRIGRRVRNSVVYHRKELRAFRKALGARTTTKQKEYLEGISRRTLFRTFPLWVTTIADVHDMIPMEAEEFDLAIIDEATQCDMASCVPILQRAKRVVVTGDPKQLRHVSFLSRERQRNISERVAGADDLADDLDFRGRSLLDLVLEHLETDRQLVFLDEHFRSRPELIAFSNEEFYDRKLKVMRACPGSAERGIRLERVAGKRDARGVNRQEAELLCAAVKKLIEGERGAAKTSSIGVLSPFRDQVDFLERKLSRELELADIRQHQLRVGTAYSFQGDERDCMFLSLALDDESHGTAFSYLQRPDVFNVSITRARHRQVVFHSFDPRKLGAGDLARRYLEQRFESAGGASGESEREGMRAEVMRALTRKGCACHCDLQVGGISIDLCIGRNGGWIGLDLIRGGGPARVLSLEELRLLERAGFPVFPLAEREWLKDPARCVERMVELLEKAESGRA